jgi:prepilin-type N-terminal cleavage/methylation domain-containing protein
MRPESNSQQIHRSSLREQASRGFTLVELLVTITIIVVLAALSFFGLNHMKFAAARSTTSSQLRQIAVAATAWGIDNNTGEPFYVANGTGTYSNERGAGANPKIAPANPPAVLYNRNSPENAYLADHSIFFSPLVKLEAPERMDYEPGNASNAKPWGTYIWYYPFTGRPTPRQSSAMFTYSHPVNTPTLDNRLLMVTDYTVTPPVWERVYLAVMIDGSVSELDISDLPIRVP